MKFKSNFYQTGRYILCLSFCLLGLFASGQTELIVKLNDASEQKYSITDEGKLYFENDYLIIEENDQISTEIAITSIRNITFVKSTVSISQTNGDDYFIYPNPARDIITIITSSDAETNLLIYNLHGRLLFQKDVFSGEQLDVAHIPAGIYLIKLNNKIIKFIKKD